MYKRQVNDAAKKRADARAEKKAKAAKAKAEADAKANCDMLGIAYDERTASSCTTKAESSSL